MEDHQLLRKIEHITQLFQNNGSLSVPNASFQLFIPRLTVHRNLGKFHLAFPYILQNFQDSNEADIKNGYSFYSNVHLTQIVTRKIYQECLSQLMYVSNR